MSILVVIYDMNIYILTHMARAIIQMSSLLFEDASFTDDKCSRDANVLLNVR